MRLTSRLIDADRIPHCPVSARGLLDVVMREAECSGFESFSLCSLGYDAG